MAQGGQASQFLFPPSSGPPQIYVADLSFSTGSVQHISWVTTLTGPYNITLWQQSLDWSSSNKLVALYQVQANSPSAQSFDWTVQTYSSSIFLSPVYFLWANEGESDGFTSHYFNITAGHYVTQTSTTSAISTTSTTSTAPTTSSTSALSTTAAWSTTSSLLSDAQATLDTPKSTSSTPFEATIYSSQTVILAANTSQPQPGPPNPQNNDTTIKLSLGIGLGIGVPIVFILGTLVGLRAIKQRKLAYASDNLSRQTTQRTNPHADAHRSWAPPTYYPEIYEAGGQTVHEVPAKQSPRPFEVS